MYPPVGGGARGWCGGGRRGGSSEFAARCGAGREARQRWEGEEERRGGAGGMSAQNRPLLAGSPVLSPLSQGPAGQRVGWEYLEICFHRDVAAEKVCLPHLRFCGKNGRVGGIQPLPVPPSAWGPAATSSVTPGCYLGSGQGDKIRVVWRHQDGVCTPFELAEIPRRVGLVVHLLFNGGFVVLGFFFLRGSIGISHAVLLAVPPCW